MSEEALEQTLGYFIPTKIQDFKTVFTQVQDASLQIRPFNEMFYK